MDRLTCEFPSSEKALLLHLRLGELDPTAPADVCAAYLVPLLTWLAAKYPKLDDHLWSTAAHEALLNYLQDHTTYDPRRGGLGTFLRMAARADLLNLLRAESRHHQRRVSWSFVEKGADCGNLSGREEEPSVNLERGEEDCAWQALLQSVREQCNEQEKRVLELLLVGERNTAVCAAALEIGDRPLQEQERLVKKVKDRLKKRLERGGESHA